MARKNRTTRPIRDPTMIPATGPAPIDPLAAVARSPSLERVPIEAEVDAEEMDIPVDTTRAEVVKVRLVEDPAPPVPDGVTDEVGGPEVPPTEPELEEDGCDD